MKHSDQSKTYLYVHVHKSNIVKSTFTSILPLYCNLSNGIDLLLKQKQHIHLTFDCELRQYISNIVPHLKFLQAKIVVQ